MNKLIFIILFYYAIYIVKKKYFYINLFLFYFTNQQTPQFSILTGFDGFPLPDPHLCIASTTSLPYLTLPKTTCFPSSQLQAINVMKN